MQPALHRGDGGCGVHVVGRGYDDGVEVLLLVEELAPVAVAARLRAASGDPLRGCVEARGIHVAERDDLLAEREELVQVRAPASARADEAHAYLLAWLGEVRLRDDVHRCSEIKRGGRAARHRERGGGSGGGFDEGASCQFHVWSPISLWTFTGPASAP